MKHLIQYKCREPGCNHSASVETSQREPLPILQCSKHRHLPVMEVTFNHTINDDKGGCENGV